MGHENRGFNTPEQIQEINRKARETIDENTKWLQETAERLGYSTVQEVDELELTEEQKRQIMYTNFALKKDDEVGFNKGYLYFRATAGDKVEAKAIVKVLGTGCFGADIFTTNNLFHKGHVANHDFNTSELEGCLKQAVETK